MTARISINGIRYSVPIVRLDGYDYFILGGTYQRLRHEKIINDRYSKDGEIDRQKKNTGKNRWRMTLVIPLSSSYVNLLSVDAGESFNFGNMSTILASDDKEYPYDGLYFYDVTSNGIFSGTYTSYVHMMMDWESLWNNDPGIFQVPVELWGRDV